MPNSKIRSKFFHLTSLIFITCFLLQVSVRTEAEIVCPPYEPGVTCWCGKTNGVNTEIQCHDRGGSQAVINHTFEEIWRLNNHTDVIQEKFIFYIQRSSDLDSFDLTPLKQLNFLSININYNPGLKSIQGGNQTNPKALINTKELVLSKNDLTDDGLVDTFKYFNSTVEYLDLRSNRIRGTYTSANCSVHELLPGLSSFINLKYLDLSSNEITRVGGGQFQKYRNLEELRLFSNGLKEIGPLAFSLDKPETPFDVDGKRLVLNLRKNNLTDEGISENNGFDLTNRPTLLNLEYNHFGFISEGKFRKFLEKDSESFILIKENPFYCDSKMNWLKWGKASLRNKVFGIKCTNDKWKNIFDYSD